VCLALFVATDRPLPRIQYVEGVTRLSIHDVDSSDASIHEKLHKPYWAYVGAWEGCGCGFEYGLLEDPDEQDLKEDEFGRSQSGNFGVCSNHFWNTTKRSNCTCAWKASRIFPRRTRLMSRRPSSQEIRWSLNLEPSFSCGRRHSRRVQRTSLRSAADTPLRYADRCRGVGFSHAR